MKVSTRTRYGLRLLVYLGSREHGSIVQVREIANHEGISFKYLEQIIRLLKKAGLLNVVRGAHGGYAIAKDPDQIPVSQVFDILESGTAPLDCLEDAAVCDNMKHCSTREFWDSFHKVIRDYLDGVTIGDLVKRQKGKDMMYYI